MSEQGSVDKAKERAAEVLGELLRQIGFEGKIEAGVQEDEILLQIESPDAARLIGRGAQVLDALQLLLNRMMLRQVEAAPHCVVDIERYRQRKKDRLVQQALEAAEEVRETGRAVTLPPMGASDRRVIHQALRENTAVQTQSGVPDEHGQKCVVISLAGQGQPDAANAASDAAIDADNIGNV